jgi:omega-6 fatty acid desaturase (delta-12 desaturase)
MSQPKVETSGQPREHAHKWKSIVSEYEKPNFWRASFQLLNTLGTYAVLWFLIYKSLFISVWIVIPLVILAGGLLVRVFIIFHDCGHGSFFKSDTANRFWGFISGLLTFTPYYHWRWEHSVHHASSGHLDRRGKGDIWTMTVQEYLASSRWKRLSYRVARNPFVLFVLAPLYVFLVRQRFALPDANQRAKASVWVMNLAILGMALGMIAIFGLGHWLAIQLSVLAIAGTSGVWLFYVQHQFEDTYWEGADEWDYTDAAMEGSSFYKLPKVLQWFTGNIGYHHIHHLSHRIPNYNLERCHRSHEMFQSVEPLTLLSSLRTLNLRLWDEASAKLISFGQLRKHLKTGTC